MKRKRFIIVSMIIVIFFVGLVFYLRTPLFYRHIAYILSYKYGFVIHADDVSYAPFLKANISNLQISQGDKNGFLFSSAKVNLESKPSMAIKGEIERFTLKEPKIQIRIGDKKSTQTDLSFIKKIPPVHTLSIQKGQFKLIFGEEPYELFFRNIDLDVQGFSPEKGGRITFNGLVDITSNGQAKDLSGHGRCSGSMSLTGLLPELIGTGTLDIHLNSGVFKSVSLANTSLHLLVSFKKEQIDVSRIIISSDSLIFDNSKNRSLIKRPYLKTHMKYDVKSKNVAFESIELEIPSFGNLKGNCYGKMKDEFPWKAAVYASDINFSTLYSYLKPFIEKPGDNGWSIHGKGAIKSEMEGTFKGNESTVSGNATLNFESGGFSSSDGRNAAQGIEGTLVLKFSIPRGDKKTSVHIYSELSSGEYLFGKYYKDLRKEMKKISFDTDLTLIDENRFDFKGSLNFFDTGTYSYSGKIDKKEWRLSFSTNDVYPDKIMSIALYDYLGEMSPSLLNLRMQGKIASEGKIVGRDEGYSIHGNALFDDVSVYVPGKSFSAENISMNMPFDLHYPSKLKPGIRSKTGFLRIGMLEMDTIKIQGLTIPFLVTANNILIPGMFEFPFYGGKIKIIECKGEDVIVPSRKFNFAAKIEGVDISSLLEEVTGLQLPGNIEAQFPLIGYEDGKWITKGITTINAFGGDIEIENVEINKPFSHERVIKGDILFKDIDLGKITETIKIGKIKGIVNGFIKNLEIAYGQPSRFLFEIDSVKKSGTEQKISVDAIDNISIIGTGSGAVGSILRSGINRFFKEYPYSRIGIKCYLENDKFHLRGKIYENGNEYFIRRAFLRGIDVINRDPNNVISFDDMQERIKRIFKKNTGEPTVSTSMLKN